MFSQETLKLVQLIKFGYYLRILPFKVSLAKTGVLQAVQGDQYHYYYQYVPLVLFTIGVRISILVCIMTYDRIGTGIQLSERLVAYEACSLLVLAIIVHIMPLVDGDTLQQTWANACEIINRAGIMQYHIITDSSMYYTLIDF